MKNIPVCLEVCCPLSACSVQDHIDFAAHLVVYWCGNVLMRRKNTIFRFSRKRGILKQNKYSLIIPVVLEMEYFGKHNLFLFTLKSKLCIKHIAPPIC